MTDLERRLLALGRELDYPPEPDIGSAVRDRLPVESRRESRAARPRAIRIIVIACLVALALAATALALSPAARDALRDLFDIGGVTIQTTTAPAPRAEPRDAPGGAPADLAEAGERLGFEPLVPSALGPPDRIRLDRVVPGGALELFYSPSAQLPRTTTTGVGLLVSELPGGIAEEYLQKVVPEATRVDRLRVDGRRAAWIAGAPHFFLYGDEAGRVTEDDLEIAQNVMLVEHGPVLVRLEGALHRPEAVRIARSLAPG
jgi:hypothetical protein